MPDAAALVRRLADRLPQERTRARRLLLELGVAAVPALEAALSDRRLSAEAAETLGALRLPQASAALLGALERAPDPKDSKDLARLGIAHALRKSEAGAPVADVVKRLAREPGPTPLAKVLVQILAGAGTAEGVAAAIEVFTSDVRFAREDFVYLLDPLRLKPAHVQAVFPRVLPLLTDAGKGNAVLVLANAFAYAGVVPHPLATKPAELIAALDSSVDDRATLAAHALGLINDPTARPALTAKACDAGADAWLRAEAALALARNDIPPGRKELARIVADGGEAAGWADEALRSLPTPKLEV